MLRVQEKPHHPDILTAAVSTGCVSNRRCNNIMCNVRNNIICNIIISYKMTNFVEEFIDREARLFKSSFSVYVSEFSSNEES